jgi:hypothetical protein
MAYLQTKFKMSSSSSSLIIFVKQKNKDNFRMASMLFYILKKHIFTKVAYFSMIYYQTSFQNTM